MTSKKDSICFDISALSQDQKVSFAKGLKKTVDKVNEQFEETQEESDE